MAIINTTPSHRPKCPNHGCPLTDLPFPLPAKGAGVCPVSGCTFEFEVDIQEGDEQQVKNKDGTLAPKRGDWRVKGNDS